MKGDTRLSAKEARRVYVLEQLCEGKVSAAQAAEILGLSLRHVKRLKKGFLLQGPSFLVHKNRGRKPSHAIPHQIRQKVIDRVLGPYRGASCQHVAELLAQEKDDPISLSAKTIRRILKEAGIPLRHTHKAARRRRSRTRMPQEGMMVQIDASPFAWLEDRGPILHLHGAIDDATGKVLGLYFCDQERALGYFHVLLQMAQNHGLPLSLYSDRHTIFFSPKRDRLSIQEQLEGKQVPLTQVGQALAALGITHIAARSPQAKGRIERLWATLQARLVIELRAAGISTLDEANRFLHGFIQRFNERFAVPAREPESAFRPAPQLRQLLAILAMKHERKPSAGSTISFQGATYQLVDSHGTVVPLGPRQPVQVLTCLDGVTRARYAGHLYTLRKLDVPKTTWPKPRPATAPAAPPGAAARAARLRPPSNHPWRRSYKTLPLPDPRHFYQEGG